MTENLQDKLPQEECKQSKGAKICATIRRELECEKCSQNFSPIICKTKHAKSNKCKTFH